MNNFVKYKIVSKCYPVISKHSRLRYFTMCMTGGYIIGSSRYYVSINTNSVYSYIKVYINNNISKRNIYTIESYS